MAGLLTPRLFISGKLCFYFHWYRNASQILNCLLSHNHAYFGKNVSQIDKKNNHILGKKKSSLKETYNRTTNGGCSKAQAPQGTSQQTSQQIPKRTPQGTPQPVSQQIPQQTPDLSRAEESDEHIYTEILELNQSMERIQEESLPLDLTKIGMACFHFYQNWPYYGRIWN